ncbi:MAG: hypothetical protein COB09_05860 [Thalassobium sp.]|nr:MAG: hypothetical protein COB09_05860 [Thalassobium sp.]
MDEFTTLAFLLAIALLGALVLGVMAFFRVSMLEQRIGILEAALRRLAAAREKPVEAGRAETAPPSTAVDSVQPATAASELAGVAASEALSAGVSEHVSEPVSEPAAELPVYSPTAPSYQAPSATPAFSSGPDLFDRLLQNIRNNWMVWLGGICVGLAGVFMVRYSIEQGLLGPETRVVLSLLAGIGLHVAAEWLRRNKGQNNVFAALAGGASIILYSALFAAFKLLPGTAPGLVFTGMALVSFATLALALRHGPVLAALGMLGGYLVPILLSSGSGQIELALVYISILTLFSLWLLAYVQQRWLWIGVIAGSLLWWLISLMTEPADGVRSLYLLALAYMFLAVPGFDWLLQNHGQDADDAAQNAEPLSWWQRVQSWRADPHWPALPGVLLVLLAQGITLAGEGVIASGYFTLLALPVLMLLAASRRPELNPLAAMPLLLIVLATVIPMLTYIGDELVLLGPDAAGQAQLGVRFLWLTLLYSGSALWLLRMRVLYPAFWTGLGSAVPLLMLALGYYLFTDFRLDWAWGLVALVLGMLYLWLANMNQQRYGDARPLISVILISAAHLGLSLAAVIWLAEATLTLAFALQLVSLAWLQQRYQLPLMAWVIRAVLLLVVVRLTFNPWLLSYDAGTHWSLWTYGGATLCAAAAAWILRHEVKMQAWLQGGAAQLLVLTLAAEVRYWLYDGDIFHHEFSFLEASLDVLIWGCAAVIYLWRARLSEQLPRFYQVVGLLHLAAAAATYLFVLLLAENPLWSSGNIGSTPLFNLLLLSYGLPTLIMLALWRQLPAQYGRFAALAAGLNAFWFISLEIRQIWQGDAGMSLSNYTPDGELYTYSVVWMLLAAGALTLGRWLSSRDIYRGGMVLLLVVVAKLFLIDMAGLTGLWRVASFMGLGLALLGLAWLHQRLGSVGEQDTLPAGDA